MKKWKKIVIWLIVFVVILGSILAFILLRPESKPEFSSAVVQEINLVQSASETGSVLSSVELDYGWEISGRVLLVEKKVGDMVEVGDVIAQLENEQQLSRLQEAQAALAAAQSRFNLEVAGPSFEQRQESLQKIAQAEAQLSQSRADLQAKIVAGQDAINSAEIALDSAKNSFENNKTLDNQSVADAYESAIKDSEEAILDGLDVLVTLTDFQYKYDNLRGSSQTAKNIVENKEVAVRLFTGAKNGGAWKSDFILEQMGGIRAEIANILSDGNFYQENEVDLFLNNLVVALRSLRTFSDVMIEEMSGESNISTTDLSTAQSSRINVDNAIKNIIDVRQTIQDSKNNRQANDSSGQISIRDAELALDSAKRKLQEDKAVFEASVSVRESALLQAKAAHDLLIASPREVDLASFRAEINQRQANVDTLQKDLEKTVLVALSSGVISKMDVDIGETVTANSPVLSIISSQLSIEVDISESDVAKISIDDQAKITLDSFGDDIVFTGSVVGIDPAETEISGVIYYTTDVLFNNPEGKPIRPGMTANVQIITATRDNAIVIPQRAILETDGKKVVRVLTNKETVDFEEREIKTGIRGDDGLVEILSGLKVGEEIITFLRENTE